MWSSLLPVRRQKVLTVALTLLLSASLQAQDQSVGLDTLNTANGLLGRGLDELAATEYQKFLAANPSDERAGEAHYGLAVSWFRRQKFSEALQEIERVPAAPDFKFAAEGLALAGQCRLALQQYDAAAATFEKLVQEHAEHELADDAGALLCEARFRQNQAVAALQAYEAFVKRWPKSPLRERVDLVRGLCEVDTNAVSAVERLAAWLRKYPQSSERERCLLALARAEQLAGKGDPAAHYRAVLEKKDSPWAADATVALAALLREKGQRDEAARLLQSLTVQKLNPALAGSAELQRGLLLLDSGKPAEALTVFDKLATGDIGDGVEAGYWAAKCALRTGDAANAAARLEKLQSKAGKSALAADILYDLAIAQVRAGKLEDARRTLAQFSATYPNNKLALEALYLSAAVEHQRRAFDASRALCEQVLAAAGNQEPASRAAFLLAENDYLAGREKDALAEFDRFERTFPNDPQAGRAAQRCGLILYRQEKYDDAARKLTPFAEAAAKDEALRPVLLALGGIAFAKNNWKDAEEHFRQYVAIDPAGSGGDEAWLKLGLACERQERYEDALQSFESLLAKFKESPHRLQALFERGQALLMLQKYEPAAKAFESVLTEGKDSRFAPLANEQLAAIAAQNKDYSRAAERYKLAADAETGSTGSLALLRHGEALLAAGKFAAAEQALAAFLEKAPDAAARVAAQTQLVLAVARQDRPADALKAAQAIDAATLDKLTPTMRAALRHEQAWCYRKLNQPDAAGKIYRMLLAQPGGDSDWTAMLALAELDAAAERFAPAVDALKRLRAAGAVVPQDLQESGWYRLGICHFKQKDFPAAAEVLDAFLKDYSGSSLAPSAAYFCGEAHFLNGKFDTAADRFTFAVEKGPQNAVCGPSLLRLGEALAALQRWPRSEQVFTDYLAKFGNSEQWPQAQFGIGWARENQSRLAEAQQAYAEVIVRHKGPTAARAQFQIGECLFAARKYDQAVKEFLKVDILYAYPEWSAAALFEAGRCFDELGKPGEARQNYGEVTKKYAGTRWAELASQRLTARAAAGVPGK